MMPIGILASPAIIASYDTDAAAYIGAAGELFPGKLNDLVLALKGFSVWAKIDSLIKAPGTPNIASSMVNLKNTAFNGTAVNSPTFSSTAGWTLTSGSSQYIDTHWYPGASGSGASQNSLHIGFRLKAVDPIVSAFICGAFGATGLGFQTQEDSNLFNGNDTAGIEDTTHTPAPSNIVGVRTSSSATAIYRNGSSVKTGTPASGTPPTSSLLIGAITSGGSPAAYAGGRLTAWFAGGALTATEVANINTALNTYMTAAGET